MVHIANQNNSLPLGESPMATLKISLGRIDIIDRNFLQFWGLATS